MKIGLIGTGLMGQALSHHLLAENQPLVVFNRSLEKCDELKARGADVATSAQALVEQCDICLLLFLILEVLVLIPQAHSYLG